MQKHVMLQQNQEKPYQRRHGVISGSARGILSRHGARIKSAAVRQKSQPQGRSRLYVRYYPPQRGRSRHKRRLGQGYRPDFKSQQARYVQNYGILDRQRRQRIRSALSPQCSARLH